MKSKVIRTSNGYKVYGKLVKGSANVTKLTLIGRIFYNVSLDTYVLKISSKEILCSYWGEQILKELAEIMEKINNETKRIYS